MADLSTFTPLRFETIASIRARMDADINAGVDPHDSLFLDTSEGGVYWDMTQACVLEDERLWDFAAVEVPASCLPQFAWGEYLDAHGEALGLTRKDSVQASGLVVFAGEPGTLVPTGTQVGATQTDPDADPVAFETTAPAVLTAIPGPSVLAATPSASGGTLTNAMTYYYVVTAVIPNPNFGQPGQPATLETIASNEASGLTPSGTASIALTWAGVATALSYNIYRGAIGGMETLLDSAGTTTYTDTGARAPGSTLPPTNVVPVRAISAGIAGNVASGAITRVLSPVSGVTAVSNPDPIFGGAEVESDEAFRERVLLALATPAGAGNVGDYLRWALAYPGIGHATVNPLWAGAGTVQVVVTDAENKPVSATIVAGLQTQLDPVPGQGAGLAPVGATVTVATPVATPVNISAALSLAAGFSLDGISGTVAVRSDINAALADYMNELAPGDDVVLEHVKSRFFAVAGVLDITTATLNGSAANVVIAADHVATMGTVTLT